MFRRESRDKPKKNFKIEKLFAFLFLSAFTILFSENSFAGDDIRDLANNVSGSIDAMPGLLAIAAYLTGILYGAIGVLKLKDAVINPQQYNSNEAISRLLTGGFLFALPIIYEAAFNTLSGGEVADIGTIMTDDFNAAFGFIGVDDINSGGEVRINTLLSNMATSTSTLPGLVMVLSYMLGILSGFSAIIKLREHIDNPQQVQIREPIVRILTAGALFALPTIIEALINTVGSDGFSIEDIFNGNIFNVLWSDGLDGGEIVQDGCIDSSVGGVYQIDAVICNIVNGTEAAPVFLVSAAYIFGLFIAVWGILKLRDHVLTPQQVSIWEGIMRLLTAAGFFALPYVVQVAYSTLTGGFGVIDDSGVGTAAVSGGGLDQVMVNFVESIFAPMSVLLNFFGLIAGMTLVMIAISRLMKSVQEGPRGPGGIGTIMTFIAGGALISFMPMVTAFSGTLFESGTITTIPELQYTDGIDQDAIDHTHAVIVSIVRFMIVLGLISFARGIFIVRAVAEGNSQASLMAGITHLVGGALAVNLGPLVNAVQVTLGLDQYGIAFS